MERPPQARPLPMDELLTGSHRRYNPLTQSWVLVSPQRLQRPWQGERTAAISGSRPAYDPACYLCPGNTRANGARNPAYAQTYAFDNDFPALGPPAGGGAVNERGLFAAQPESGRCRVVCFSPRHDLDIATMDEGGVCAVIDTWAEQTEALGGAGAGLVTVFENRGEMMGASNPHPHSQIWASQHAPVEIERERDGFAAYRRTNGGCLLCDYAALEVERGHRVIYADASCCVVVPFWAVWPFEALLIPLGHRESLQSCAPHERASLARAMQALTRRYDALFSVPFPYSMGWHQDGHLHAHYYPPLLRSAGVRKYQVGYEMLAQPQRDITPEQAAAQLRAL